MAGRAGRDRRGGGRLLFERRLQLWLAVLMLPNVVLAGWMLYRGTRSAGLTALLLLPLVIAEAFALAMLFERLMRPLQTLANVVAALREDDFSFRARGAQRGDALGDLALEINTLAAALEAQRGAANDALSLAEQVMRAMPSPVLAFGLDGRLRLLNPAAEQAFSLLRGTALGRAAADLHLQPLLAVEDEGMFPPERGGGLGEAQTGAGGAELARAAARWSVRRSVLRVRGVPHTFFLLTDVARVLQLEERAAWQRLIRVLSHEINNSLTPIQSIAGSLRMRVVGDGGGGVPAEEMGRGLEVVEERAASLHRFLAAYQQLAQLPAPAMRAVELRGLLERVVRLETRLPVRLLDGPEVRLEADADQLQQLLINLVKNGVEAAQAGAGEARVEVGWTAGTTEALVWVRDSGPGLVNPGNVFVPFYTTKPKGSGIGLALARQIALAHGGVLRLGNNVGAAGCTAEVSLPLRMG